MLAARGQAEREHARVDAWSSPPYPKRVELPPDLFQLCLWPTDSSTPVRFHAGIAMAACALHVEAFTSLDVHAYEVLGHCGRELLATPRAVGVSEWGGPDHDRMESTIEEPAPCIPTEPCPACSDCSVWGEHGCSRRQGKGIAMTYPACHPFCCGLDGPNLEPL